MSATWWVPVAIAFGGIGLAFGFGVGTFFGAWLEVKNHDANPCVRPIDE